MRVELQSVLDSLNQLLPQDMPALLGELEVIRATAQLRMSAPAPVASKPDEQIDVREAAQRLGVSTDYLYGHARQFPFARREGRKWLFSGHGIAAYIAKKSGNGNAVLTARRH